MTAQDYAREHLLKLDMLAFRALVDQDCRGLASNEAADALRSGEVAVTERWYHALVFAKKNVENQLASKRTELKGQVIRLVSQAESLESGDIVMDGPRVVEVKPPTPEGIAKAKVLRREAAGKQSAYHQWRAGALRFRAATEERLTEASWKRSAFEKSDLIEQRRVLEVELIRTTEELAAALQAIRDHRAALADVDQDEIGDEDRNLWTVIEGGLDGQARARTA